jgi:hypothetical protein
MSSRTILAVILITVGVVVLAYSGITLVPYTWKPQNATSFPRSPGRSRWLAGSCCWRWETKRTDWWSGNKPNIQSE